jgi:acyl-homoserine lactone acylase PvdQ
MIEEWERFGAREPARALAIDRAVEALRTWDQISRTDSEASALFLLWLERFRRAGGAEGEWPRMRALEEVIAGLKQQWEGQRVTWGEINRLQRIHTNGGVPFDDNAMSLAVPGAPVWAGVIFAFTTTPGPSAKRRYGVSGHTWVGVVEFGPRPTARSVVPFGQSADPTSPHWFDQAALYVKAEFKQAWFWREDVERQARRTYRPGPAIAHPAQGAAR